MTTFTKLTMAFCVMMLENGVLNYINANFSFLAISTLLIIIFYQARNAQVSIIISIAILAFFIPTQNLFVAICLSGIIIFAITMVFFNRYDRFIYFALKVLFIIYLVLTKNYLLAIAIFFLPVLLNSNPEFILISISLLIIYTFISIQENPSNYEAITICALAYAVILQFVF